MSGKDIPPPSQEDKDDAELVHQYAGVVRTLVSAEAALILTSISNRPENGVVNLSHAGIAIKEDNCPHEAIIEMTVIFNAVLKQFMGQEVHLVLHNERLKEKIDIDEIAVSRSFEV
jgi:hypothetical protein